MTSFDENKLTAANYNIGDPIQVVNYTSVVEEFMEIVRTDPAYLAPRQHLFDKFCTFVDDDEVWQIVLTVVPEFHLPTTFNTNRKTAMNVILAKLKHRRPLPPIDDTSGNEERLLVKRRLIECVYYIIGHGRSTLTDQQRREADDLIARAIPVVGRCSLKEKTFCLCVLLTTSDPLINL